VVSAAIGALLFFRIAVFAVVVSPTNSAFFSALAHRGYVIEALAFVTLKRVLHARVFRHSVLLVTNARSRL
jgi:ABC-type microcin C transport system permease subunit YejB